MIIVRIIQKKKGTLPGFQCLFMIPEASLVFLVPAEYGLGIFRK